LLLAFDNLRIADFFPSLNNAQKQTLSRIPRHIWPAKMLKERKNSGERVRLNERGEEE